MVSSDIDETLNLCAHTLNKLELEKKCCSCHLFKNDMFCSEQGTYQWCDWIEYENNWPVNGIMYRTSGFFRGG